jgi:hypothetical protein
MTTPPPNILPYAPPRSTDGSGLEEKTFDGTHYEKPSTGDGWERCIRAMTAYDEKNLERWRNELSDLLLFVKHSLFYAT